MKNEYDNKSAEQLYHQLLEYEKEVSDFLVYMCGYHSISERKQIFEIGECKANELSQKLERIVPMNFFNEHEKQCPSFLYSEYLRVSRNTHNWLNVIFSFFQFQRNI